MSGFLKVFKCEQFFFIVPLGLLDIDMNSQSYSLDSRSYLLPVIAKTVDDEPLEYFVDTFIPLVRGLEEKRDQYETH